jgi:hypothetical protein
MTEQENTKGLDPVILAKRDEIAACRMCARPCACYRNPQDGDCMDTAQREIEKSALTS